jgi:hypothetical protein
VYKDILIKLIKKEKVSNIEFNEFITDYIYKRKNIYPTGEQLQLITRMIFQGIISIDYIIKEAIKDFNIQIITVSNLKTGQILRIDVYG